MLTAFITIGGILSFQRMPVDAYPDLSPPQVEIITQWPDHASEEVERLVTLPLEIEMNGVPHMEVMRSISLYGLSDIILTFEESTNDYFARQIVFERLAQATLPTGVSPGLAPLFSPSGLVYRYVLESPDRSPQELKTIEDWVIERAYRSVHGVADDSGFGGTVMQYQVLLDPARIYGYHLTVPQVTAALAANNANAGGGFYSQGGQFYYVRGIGLVRNTEDIGNVVVGENKGVPVRVRDVGDVTIGHAPRLGEFGYQKNDDAVEGVILMLRGEQTQNVLKGVEAKTEELNRDILPPDVKIHPYYDRSELVDLTTDTVEANLLRGMVLVLIVLIFFLVSFRAAIIVAVTIPLSLLFAFIVLHAHDVAANLLSIGAIDFGIVIDGTVVMMENIYRELALREGQDYQLNDVILAAAKDVDRPIFYSVAVILAGYLPIYALSGPAGKLFHPMAETMSFALVGALILTLTLIPVLASYWFKNGVREKPNRAYEWMKEKYATQLDWALDRPKTTLVIATVIFGAALLLIPFIGGEFMPHLDEGALWVRATMPYTISFEEASTIAPQIRSILMSYPQVTVVGSELGRPDDGTDPTGFFNCEFYVGLKAYKDKAWHGDVSDKKELIESINKKLTAFPGIIFNYTQPAEDAVDEALTGLKSSLAVKIYGEDLNVLQDKAIQIKNVLAKVPGFTELTVVRELGQPSLLVAARALSTSGGSRASHLRQAPALLTAPVIGWLTHARSRLLNSPIMLLTRLMCASSASSCRSLSRCSSARKRSVMSRATISRKRRPPYETRLVCTSTGNFVPSFRRCQCVSNTVSPAAHAPRLIPSPLDTNPGGRRRRLTDQFLPSVTKALAGLPVHINNGLLLEIVDEEGVSRVVHKCAETCLALAQLLPRPRLRSVISTACPPV